MMKSIDRLNAISKGFVSQCLLVISSLLFLAIAAQAQSVPKPQVYQAENLTVIFRDLPTKQVIHLIGVLTSSDAEVKHFSKLFKIDPRKELILNLSGYKGGKTSSAEKFVQVIKERCSSALVKGSQDQTCDFTTYVNDRHDCVSACIIPYMAGKKRIACDNSRFGFHSIQYGFGGIFIKGSVQKSIDFLTSAGVSKSWATKNAKALSSKDITYMRPSEMGGSNIVTTIDRQCDLILPSI